MSQFDELREQIDACRPGSGDLALPQLAELALAARQDASVADELARSQRYDSAVAAAMHDVPISAGLLERLLTATKDAAQGMTAPATDAAAVSLPAVRQRGRILRRWLLAGGSALVLALGVGLYQGLRPPRTVKEAELGGAVESWLTQLQPSLWRSLASGKYPPEFPPDPSVSATPRQWQALNSSQNGWSASLAAVDIAPAGRPRAVLFVIRSSATFKVPTLPLAASGLPLSKGMKATAWQRTSSSVLYVLAVEEVRGQTLGDYLQPQRLTRHRAWHTGQSL
jgi:hypothetical protein